MIFTQDSSVEDAFKLPVGRYLALFPDLPCEQEVSLDLVQKSAKSLLACGKQFSASSQAGVIVNAQQLTDDLDNFAPFRLL